VFPTKFWTKNLNIVVVVYGIIIGFLIKFHLGVGGAVLNTKIQNKIENVESKYKLSFKMGVIYIKYATRG
jgi:hypothetical protein